MVQYFKWVFNSLTKINVVEASPAFNDTGGGDGPSLMSSNVVNNSNHHQFSPPLTMTGDKMTSSSTLSSPGRPPPSKSLPWYMIQMPKHLPKFPTYTPSIFDGMSTLEILGKSLASVYHLSTEFEGDTGNEGLMGVIRYGQLPEIELGVDVDAASFFAGAVGCILIGLYFDDILYQREFTIWWPTRWFWDFLEEGVYLWRTVRWSQHVTLMLLKLFWRGLYGGSLHTFCRIFYYAVRKKLCGNIPYAPLFDDTFAAWVTGYTWTGYSMITEEYTVYDQIIYTGWIGIITGLVEYGLVQYCKTNQSPGLFQWFFGGAFSGPGIIRYIFSGVAKDR